MVEGDTHKSKNDYCNVEEGIQPTRCCTASINNNVHDNSCILPSSYTLNNITSKRSTAVEYKIGAVNAAYVTDDREHNKNSNSNNNNSNSNSNSNNNNNNNSNNNTIDLEKGEKVADVTINGTTTTTTASASASTASAGQHYDEGGNNNNNNTNNTINTINTNNTNNTHNNNNNNNNNNIRTGFEQSIELCGYGRFHYVLLGICGLVSTSEEMDVISMSFILPSAQCDLDLNTTAKGWLNSVIFVGMMVGAYFWGSIADSVGRKKVLIVISFMNGVCIVASSFSQTYEWFMLFRFLNGAALGGSGPVIWSYFAEFQPKAKRGSMLSFMASFWTFGNLFVAGLAWLIIPTNVGVRTAYFVYNSWRIFLMVCSVPSFIVAFLLLYLPESPKYLLSKGKHDKALAIFRGIFVTNTKRPADQYPVGQLEIDEKTLQELHANANANKDQKRGGHGRNRSRLNKMMSGIVDHGRQLFSAPILKFTIVSIVINFTFHIGYYGLMMWFPELFNRFEKYHVDNPDGEREAGVCTVIEHVSRLAVPSATPDDICVSHIPSNVFMESLISLSSALPANLIAILAMDRLGRKFFLIFGTLTAGLCSAAMYFVSNATQNLVVTAIFSGAISAANAALDCLITEVFPTHLRATGVAISMVAARLGGIIGNIVIATLLDRYCPAPTVIVATLLIGGGLMCLLLPNTTRRELN